MPRKGTQSPEAHLYTREEAIAAIHKWDNYAWKLAMQWHRSYGRWAELDDFHAAVIAGFWDATRRYDKTRGLSFMTYAQHYARRDLQELVAGAMGVKRGRFATDREIANGESVMSSMGVSDLAFECLLIDRSHRPEDNPEFPHDFWKKVNSVLDKRHRKVIALRFRCGLKLDEIGAMLGVTRERVRQIEKTALRRLANCVDFSSSFDNR